MLLGGKAGKHPDNVAVDLRGDGRFGESGADFCGDVARGDRLVVAASGSVWELYVRHRPISDERSSLRPGTDTKGTDSESRRALSR
mgnify:CR=1 FL=1